jgi:hypothetical protein
MKAFDYPRCELHDLFCRQDLLCDESAHNHITDLECIGGLLQSDPEPLLRWRAYRETLSVTNMLYTLLRPGIAVTSAIAHPHWQICGVPDILYTDNGADFTSKHLQQVAADLKIRLVFSIPGKPQGRGRIERFFRTVNEMFLCDLDSYIRHKKRTPQSVPGPV